MTLVEQYIVGIREALRNSQSLPGHVENSPMRAHGRDDPQVINVMPGAEKIVSAATPRVTRSREVHLTVLTAGNEHLELCEAVFEVAHPIVMGFNADGITQIDEIQTDEPRYAGGDLTRQAVTKRYLITYQTLENSLS